MDSKKDIITEIKKIINGYIYHFYPDPLTIQKSNKYPNFYFVKGYSKIHSFIIDMDKNIVIKHFIKKGKIIDINKDHYNNYFFKISTMTMVQYIKKIIIKFTKNNQKYFDYICYLLKIMKLYNQNNFDLDQFIDMKKLYIRYIKHYDSSDDESDPDKSTNFYYKLIKFIEENLDVSFEEYIYSKNYHYDGEYESDSEDDADVCSNDDEDDDEKKLLTDASYCLENISKDDIYNIILHIYKTKMNPKFFKLEYKKYSDKIDKRIHYYINSNRKSFYIYGICINLTTDEDWYDYDNLSFVIEYFYKKK
jgi:hypothetical protein